MPTDHITMYSQGLEEPAILSACSGIDRGRFLDIGAWHAKDKSNTRALYELGWGGVLIEPSPAPLRGLIQEYGNDPRISVVSAAIGPERGIVKLHVTDDATSTTDEANFHKWNRICNFYGSFWVPCITLLDVLSQFGGFDMVSVDAEGISGGVFRQLMATEMKPQCVVVEHDNDQDALKSIAKHRGYRCTFENGENLVFSI